MLNWLRRFNICCFLDNHEYSLQPHSHDCIVAAGTLSMSPLSGSPLDSIEELTSKQQDYLFGHLGYDLKNEIEGLESKHPDHIGFPDAFLFIPQYVLIADDDKISIGSLEDDHQLVYDQICEMVPDYFKGNRVDIKQRINREEYVDIIRKLQDHIHRGDCYEINFCMEFFAEHAVIDPYITYSELCRCSPNPFSVFYRVNDSYLMCASPERFMSKSGKKLVSQPIKGTITRAPGDPGKDLELKAELQNSLKDRTENVMIVDLVRNDLSKVCREGTVRVEEMFGIHAFPQVYQMVSTVTGELRDDVGFREIVEACFPMGSMTGAPKRRVLELIERYEKSRRGIFSGSVGYISPSQDFDLNVVIRSIMYNGESGYLSFQAGSGITAASDPEAEYEECILKASTIKQLLSKGA